MQTSSEMPEAMRMPDSDHWLACYIRNLLQAYKMGKGIDFDTAEALLAQEKQAFEKELAMARKFYRLYPHLVDQASQPGHVESPAQRTGE
jgi:hypothetical protein